MENYNEKVNYGDEKTPILRDRLSISSTTYGFNLFDKKIKKNILSYKSKEVCEEGKALLLAGKPDLFESFKERVKNDEVVIPNKILIYSYRDYHEYFSIPTLKDLHKVSLHILKNIVENDSSICEESKIPEPLDYTEEDILKLPESFRNEAKKKLEKHNYTINSFKKYNNLALMIKKSIETDDGKLAFEIMRDEYGIEVNIFNTILL